MLRNEILYIWIVEGSTESTDGRTKTSEASISVYGADQDGDKDGLPDAGQTPVLYIPLGPFGTAKRVP